MAAQTLGQFLINDALPEKYRSSETHNKSSLTKMLTDIATEDPQGYVGIVSNLKRVGDEISTLEGVSVGLDDIAPVYKERDKILKPAITATQKATTYAGKERAILKAQEAMLKHTRTHPGSMTQMALSGSRGNIPQLMKTVSAPIATADATGKLVPWLVSRSYSQGLTAADYWVTGNESRLNTITSATAVAEPGDLAKIMVNNLYPMIISKDDCGTLNGVSMQPGDGQATGRYLAKDAGGLKRNDLVTARNVTQLREKTPLIYVRSPLTCEADEGVCRKCQGLDEKGKPHAIGVNVGVRAAQALSGPLTQFALSAKHGTRLLKGDTPKLHGLSGVRQLLEVPQSFFNKATLAEQAGTVTKIETAPHGGNYVTVGSKQHYTPPNLKVLVRKGQVVEAGDALSEGIPKPDEVVKYKGFGAGRQYLVNALHDVYGGQGLNVDKRHLELLARADLNHVKIEEQSDRYPQLLKGDTVSYTTYRNAVSPNARAVPLERALGKLLGKEVLQLTVGTPITNSVIAELRKHNITEVAVAEDAPRIEFLMRPMTRSPLLNPDWMARMSHRYLKESVVRGAHFGESANLHGAHPVPAYAYGLEFGTGSDGRY